MLKGSIDRLNFLAKVSPREAADKELHSCKIGSVGGWFFCSTAAGKLDCTDLAAFCRCLFCLIQLYISQRRPSEYKPSHQKRCPPFCSFVGSWGRHLQIWPATSNSDQMPSAPPQLQRLRAFPLQATGRFSLVTGKELWLCKRGGTQEATAPEVSGAAA